MFRGVLPNMLIIRRWLVFNTVFSSILTTTDAGTSNLTPTTFLICSLASLVLGVCIALVYMFKNKASKSFVVTVALLPFIVQMVIALVNGNIGAGIAVMGVFNLVRFRSIPGSAKDIGTVFMAMAVGLATGMGFITLAIAFTVLVAIANIVFTLSPLGGKLGSTKKTLKVTVPEDMEFDKAFDDIFEKYTTESELVSVKTTNLGALYELAFEISLSDSASLKKMMDEIRLRNGNLSVQCTSLIQTKETL